MNCPHCGYADSRESTRFCPNCGKELAAQSSPPTPGKHGTRIDLTQEVGNVAGGQVTGAQVGSVAGDLDVTVKQIVQGDYVSQQTIVMLGPEAVEQIVQALTATQKLEHGPLQTVMAQAAPDHVGRQIGAVVAAQRELAAAGTPVNPRTAYRLGMLAAYDRDYDTALSYFRQATRADPEYVEAFAAISWLQQFRAMSDLNAEDYDAAIARLAEAREAAMHTDPLDASALAQRGYIAKTLAQVADARHRKAERQKYYDEAARLFEQAARLDPDDAGAQNGLGNVQYALGNLDAAIAAYERAIASAPGYTAAYHDLGLAYEAKMGAEPSAAGQWRERALKAWQEAYRLAPDDPGFSADDVLAIGRRIRWLENQ